VFQMPAAKTTGVSPSPRWLAGLPADADFRL
jgi:hypothetical protein